MATTTKLPNDWTYETTTSVTLPAGTYWFGDLGYILPEEIYSSVFGGTNYSAGHYTHPSGDQFVVGKTYKRMGTYLSTHTAYAYSVHSGSLGIVSVSLLKKYDERFTIPIPSVTPNKSIELEDGVLYHFTNPVKCTFNHSVFRVTSEPLSFVVDTFMVRDYLTYKYDESEDRSYIDTNFTYPSDL